MLRNLTSYLKQVTEEIRVTQSEVQSSISVYV